MSTLSVISAIEKSGIAAVEGVKKTVEGTAKEISESSFKEFTKARIEAIKQEGDVVAAKLNEIKDLTPEQLKEKLNENLKKIEETGNSNIENTDETKETDESKYDGLTDEEKIKIKEETGWSDDIIDNIRSMKEYEIYKNAGLMEVEIDGKKCLIRDDIDWNQIDEKGRTNQQRVEQGLAPLDKNGNKIQLHHIGQRADSPLAELTFDEHRRNGNDTILHDKSMETETHGEGSNWDSEREDYWKKRGEYNSEGGNSNG